VGKSLRHSCRSELTRQGISLPSNRYSYGCRLPRASEQRLHVNSFTLRHWAGVRFYTSYQYLAESCVFNKQSLPPILCHRINFGHSFPEVTSVICRVPSILLPHRLNAFHLSTCVGLRYGTKLQFFLEENQKSKTKSLMF
jgi:hypothetical protein